MTDYRFADLQAEYGQLWSRMQIRPERREEIDRMAAKLLANKARYQRVSEVTGAPWYLIAALHQRESGADFARHLHEGSPLTDRTKRVPKGRPANGHPPFTWEQSAIDALTIGNHDMRRVSSWTIERICFEAEKYNGWGYRNRGRPSPYLLAGSTEYVSGKFVGDHQFDAHAVDKQCGVAPIVKRLAELDGSIVISRPGSALVPVSHISVPEFDGIGGVPELTPVPAPQNEDAFARLVDALLARNGAHSDANGRATKILSPIDKLLGGETLAGSKTTLAIGAYALLSILEATGAANATSPTSEIMTTLIGSFGGLGVLAKIDRAIKALSIIAVDESRRAPAPR
jgi:lysozyme family protein